MFLNFFYRLKARRIPVSTQEFLDLLRAVQGMVDRQAVLTLTEFYSLSRSCLVKDLKYYDDFDLVFAQEFESIALSDGTFQEQLMSWLQQAIQKALSEKQKQQAPRFDDEELWKELEKRLQEQKERHDGGNYWIGTGGTSPFGNSGYNENGIRIGGTSQNKSAVNVAKARKYQEYRTEEVLGTRQLKVALKKLRLLKKTGVEELSVPASIDKTCDNAGEIELVYEKSRKNHLKLLLLMDIGGSMTPYSHRVSQLFSASHQMNHFKEFHYYYFHNIIYDSVYLDANLQHTLVLEDFFRKHSSDTYVIFVGDALMNPYELFVQTGFRGFWQTHPQEDESRQWTGLQRLQQMKQHFSSMIWLNPENPRFWQEPTIEAIESTVPMFFLSIAGLQRGIESLLTR
ncbi:MAG: VWA containing CoxE family protein [Spirochaetota bacterium]